LGIGVKTVEGSGDVIVEKRDVESFNQMVVDGDVEVYFTQLNEGIEVHAESNLSKYVHTRVEEQTLYVKIADTDGGEIVIANLEPIRVYVNTVRINRINLSGGAELTSSQILAEDAELDLSLSEGSVGYINAVRTGTLYISLSEGSELKIVDGQVTEQIVTASDGSTYLAEWLKSETCELEFSSGSEATIWATDTLSVDLTGGSMVYYFGSPETLNEIESSGGSDYISEGEH
jgi:hypothetical protein